MIAVIKIICLNTCSLNTRKEMEMVTVALVFPGEFSIQEKLVNFKELFQFNATGFIKDSVVLWGKDCT